MMRATKSTPKNDDAEKPSSNADGTAMSWRYCSSSLSTLRGMDPTFREKSSLGERVVVHGGFERERPPTQELLAKVVDEGSVPAHPRSWCAVQPLEIDHDLVDAGDVRGWRVHGETL